MRVTTIELSQSLVRLAEQYVNARRQSGESLLDAAGYLAQARKEAKHGEWYAFLAATGTSEDLADRLLTVHNRAVFDRPFAEAVRSNWLSLETAALLARPNTPQEIINQALAADEPPTRADLRSAISLYRNPAPARDLSDKTLDEYFTAHPERERFVCGDCGETFDLQVWHCPICDHHWQMHRIECWNCHEYERDLDSAERAELSKMEEWGEIEDELTQAPGDWYTDDEDEGEEPIESRMSQPMQIMTSRGTVEWYTPPGIIERVRAVLGKIDLDPASSDVAQQWIQAETYYTAETPTQEPWAGRVWLNPPFSATPLWVSRLEVAYNAGNVTEAILLVNSAVGYIWWEGLWRRRPVCMLRERLCFYQEDGTVGGQAKKGTTIAYYGQNTQRFIEHFCDLGRIILPDA